MAQIKYLTGLLLLLLSLHHSVLGFSSSPAGGPPSNEVSRREAMSSLLVGLVGGATVVLADPAIAQADITNKIASSAAFRSLQRAEKKLPSLLPTVQENDFVGVKSFFRTPPFDEVRKNGSILVRGGEDGPKANELQVSYKDLIGSIEKIDGTASIGMRGRKVPQLQLLQEYDTVLTSMGSFLKVAGAALEIPVQYAD